jgi:hypothetical protein
MNTAKCVMRQFTVNRNGFQFVALCCEDCDALRCSYAAIRARKNVCFLGSKWRLVGRMNNKAVQPCAIANDTTVLKKTQPIICFLTTHI